jgi:hypothetical protein
MERKKSWPRFVDELSKTKKNLVKPVTVPTFETGVLPNASAAQCAPTFDSEPVYACAMIFICENNKGYIETVSLSQDRESVWLLATGWTVRGSSPVGDEIFRTLQTGPGVHPASCK